MKEFEKLKAEYDATPIPQELNDRIQQGMRQGRRRRVFRICRRSLGTAAACLVVAVGVSARELENCLQEALRNARRNFGITLARRGEFTATVASADWVETGSWDLMVSLAESRLYNP